MAEILQLMDQYGVGAFMTALVVAYAIVSYRNNTKLSERQTQAIEASAKRQSQVFEESTKQQNEVLREVAKSNEKVADTLGVIRELLSDKFGYLEGKILANHTETVLLVKNHCTDVVRIENCLTNVATGMSKVDERTKACAERSQRYRKGDSG